MEHVHCPHHGKLDDPYKVLGLPSGEEGSKLTLKRSATRTGPRLCSYTRTRGQTTPTHTPTSKP